MNTQNYDTYLDKTKIMIFGTRQGQHFNLGGHTLNLY